MRNVALTILALTVAMPAAAQPAFPNTVIDPPAPSLPPLEFDGRTGAPPAPSHDR